MMIDDEEEIKQVMNTMSKSEKRQTGITISAILLIVFLPPILVLILSFLLP